MKLSSLVVLLTLSACSLNPPELSVLENRGVAAALRGWLEAGLPSPTVEKCDLKHPIIRWAKDNTEWDSLCRADAEKHAACLLWDSSANWFRPTLYPIVELVPGFQLDPVTSEPLIHELMHAQYHCADMNWAAPENVQHLNPKVWSAAEVEPGSSAQSRARKLMTGEETLTVDR